MSKPTGERKDDYNVSQIKSVLANLGYELLYFPQIESTMKIIDANARKGINFSSVALTDHQTKGEGRQGRVWMDSPGKSLMFSALFQIPQSSIAAFADLAALSICSSLKKTTGLDIKIKYPNDIVYQDKKIGGILVRNIYDDKLQYIGTNVGAGLNIHYTAEELNKFRTDYPTISLDVCSSGFHIRQDLLIDILKNLRYMETEIKVFDTNPNIRDRFEKMWKENSCLLNREIKIFKNDTIIATGKVIDTRIGEGVKLYTKEGGKWFTLFDTDTKARIIN